MKEKNKGGRPKKYSKKEEIQKKIDAYFKSCYKPILTLDKKTMSYEILKDKDGNETTEQYKPFTISGLADALDLTRQSLLNYSEEEEFFDTIMRAKRKCEIYTEERLFDKDGVKGAVFSLSNNFSDWKTKQENINVETSYEEYMKKVADENEY